MNGSGQAYQQLIQRVAEALPEVAAQVRDEVARGRIVAGSKLSSTEREEREIRMLEAKVGKIAKADVVSVPYNDDERLALLVDSLIRVAFTMRSSRQALAELHTGLQTGPVAFEEPDGSERVEVLLSEEVSSSVDVAEAVDRLLATALEELGGTP